MPVLNRCRGGFFAVWVALCSGAAMIWAQERNTTLRVYLQNGSKSDLVASVSADDLRMFDGRAELKVTRVARAPVALDTWVLVNRSPRIREALVDSSLFQKGLLGTVRQGDRVHFGGVCAEHSAAVVPDSVEFAEAVRAALTGPYRREPVTECLFRFAEQIPGTDFTRRTHLILIADDDYSSPSGALETAKKLALRGLSVSVIHIVEPRKRGRRAGWLDLPPTPPPQAPVPTAVPPPVYPDRNIFDAIPEYTGGDLERMRRLQPIDRVVEVVERFRDAYTVCFEPSLTGPPQERYLSFTLSERGVRNHPSLSFRFARVAYW